MHAGKLLLKVFSFPYEEDGKDVAEKYPWLVGWDPGCPKAL
jgi:hypothetical protein